MATSHRNVCLFLPLHLDFRLLALDDEMARMSLAVTKTFSAWN